MEEIIIHGTALMRINGIYDALLAKGYFSYEENAADYTNAIYNFILSIPTQKHYHTKRPGHGRYYARYKANSHTTYYITFDTDGQRYLIKNIFSNHQPQYPRYIKGI